MAHRKYRLVVCVLALLVPACSSSPAGPTVIAPKPALREMAYDINIPDVGLMLKLKAEYPNGVQTSPVSAQLRWDFTQTYGGTPNVYFGEVAPRCQYVLRVGIVVAPYRVASMDTFTSSDWNMAEPGFIYAWVGRFVYAAVAAPGSYTYNPTATCS